MLFRSAVSARATRIGEVSVSTFGGGGSGHHGLKGSGRCGGGATATAMPPGPGFAAPGPRPGCAPKPAPGAPIPKPAAGWPMPAAGCSIAAAPVPCPPVPAPMVGAGGWLVGAALGWPLQPLRAATSARAPARPVHLEISDFILHKLITSLGKLPHLLGLQSTAAAAPGRHPAATHTAASATHTTATHTHT